MSPEDSVESLLGQHKTTTSIVYLTTILSVITAVTFVMITSVDVTLAAPASLAPEIERQQLRIAEGGAIEQVRAHNGSVVRAGDTILVLMPSGAERIAEATLINLRAQTEYRNDLRLLLALHSDTMGSEPVLATASGRADLRVFVADWNHASAELAKAREAQDRLERLVTRGFAAPAELQVVALDAVRAREARTRAVERTRVEWAATLASLEARILQLRRDTVARLNDRAGRVVLAPVAGTLEDMVAVTTGSTVRAGEVVATISPNAAVVAEAFVAPRDVSYLRTGMAARIRIDGLDVQSWGVATATVTAIASDFTVIANRPGFRVRIKPERNELIRSDGRRIRLTKGLQGQVRFVVGRRRLLDLLRGSVRDWLDPSSGAKT